jgi:hypothetical protein
VRLLLGVGIVGSLIGIAVQVVWLLRQTADGGARPRTSP